MSVKRAIATAFVLLMAVWTLIVVTSTIATAEVDCEDSYAACPIEDPKTSAPKPTYDPNEGALPETGASETTFSDYLPLVLLGGTFVLIGASTLVLRRR